MHKHGVRIGAVLLLCLLLLLFIQVSSEQRTVAVKSEEQFETLIGRSELAVVMFYQRDKALMKRDKRLAQFVKRLERMFIMTSKMPRYRESRVHFLMVNVDYDNLDFVARSHGISRLPTYMLFSDGEMVRTKENNPAALAGMVSAEKLRSFIENFFHARIKQILKDRAQARREASYYRPYLGWGFGWGWGSPYYWNYPYYGYYGPWWW